MDVYFQPFDLDGEGAFGVFGHLEEPFAAEFHAAFPGGETGVVGERRSAVEPDRRAVGQPGLRLAFEGAEPLFRRLCGGTEEVGAGCEKGHGDCRGDSYGHLQQVAPATFRELVRMRNFVGSDPLLQLPPQPVAVRLVSRGPLLYFAPYAGQVVVEAAVFRFGGPSVEFALFGLAERAFEGADQKVPGMVVRIHGLLSFPL